MSGSLALAEELFARGDPAFVGELRKVHDAERLGAFATRWLVDKRPAARQLLLDYLSLPLNAYRHEALVKRLFKGVEKARDDDLMGAFLVALDRSIRRQRKTVTRHKHETFSGRSQAEQQQREWTDEGYEIGPIQNYSGRFYVYGYKREQVIVAPPCTMPRPPKGDWKRSVPVPDSYREWMEKRFFLFSLPTRRYLRRRAWRYFRDLGKANDRQYLKAASAYLKRYTDADVDSDIHLLDNWGLVHTLFHHSPALIRPAKGWELAPEKTLADLAPAPRFADSWNNAPGMVFQLALEAGCRTVRLWAVRLLRASHAPWLGLQPVDVLLKLIDHSDTDVAALGFDLLERCPNLGNVEIWLSRLDGDNLEKLQRLSALLAKRLDAQSVGFADTIKLAMHRSLPVARLGFTLLQKRAAFSDVDVPSLLTLTQAECESIRPEIAGWLREQLTKIGPPKAEWLLEFLDSKHANMRSAGWIWLQETAFKDEPAVWHKLLESPYDDIKGPLVAALSERAKNASRDLVQFLWASVLVNIHRGGRYKPGVVAQINERLAEHPEEAGQLLPLLAIAVRSLRGPEFRAGLAGVVSLVETQAELRPAIKKQFPELVVG
jgi:hypothetical protein